MVGKVNQQCWIPGKTYSIEFTGIKNDVAITCPVPRRPLGASAHGKKVRIVPGRPIHHQNRDDMLLDRQSLLLT